jgi:hypothetical protein
VTVSAAADLLGNPLGAAPYRWVFTTGGQRVYLLLVMGQSP